MLMWEYPRGNFVLKASYLNYSEDFYNHKMKTRDIVLKKRLGFKLLYSRKKYLAG